jgi:predicted MPP superfamily phosphohydrolase
MTTPIQTKVAQLRAAGINLGTQVTAEVDAGYGGKMQQFSNFTIYYHAVMGTVAHEVHGGVRAKYLGLGGHGPHPTTGQRLLGFPMTDEIASDDSRFQVSRFEWGAIYWGFGGVAVYGNLYTHYRSIGGEKGRLGYPVSDVVTVSDGRVAYFEHGALYSGTRSNNSVIEISYLFPQLGQPWMLQQGELAGKPVLKFTYLTSMNVNKAGHLLNELFGSRIFLRETGGTAEFQIGLNYLGVTSTSYTPNYHHLTVTLAPLAAGLTMQNRRLYDFILKVPNQAFAIGPHSVYIRNNWTDFKFIHATDTHVSRRVDLFRAFFVRKGMTEAATKLNNFNDRFRELIRYANKLWREGNLDFIMVTGDLVDYCFEDSRKRYGDNNFVFLEQIIRGQTGKPDQVQNDELLVPIFTSLGNHDYRVMPYYPYFKVDVPGEDMQRDQCSSFNITSAEGDVLTRELLGITSSVGSSTAFAMVSPDRDNNGGNLNHYFRYINRDPSYMIHLGNHSLVMIDGRWDDGPVENTTDAINVWIGNISEATRNFVGGSPDSVGFRSVDTELVAKALRKTGLTFVGVHAPLVNPKYSDYSYFIREQIRVANPPNLRDHMRKYLFRKEPSAFTNRNVNNTYSLNLAKDVLSSWSRTNTPYFNEGDGDQLLDYGVMRGYRAEFLKLCLGGITGPRPVDLVLSGHVHKNWECKVTWNAANGKFRHFHDFYTENPAKYYDSLDTNIDANSVIVMSPLDMNTGTGAPNSAYMNSRKIHIKVDVTDAAAVNELPVTVNATLKTIRTKPYARTLNSQVGQAACATWWQTARPLLIQTSALGPSDSQRETLPPPDFRGCRIISVGGNVIQRINYVTMQNIVASLAGLPGSELPGGGIGGLGGVSK